LSILSPRDGYRLWAPTYSAETVVTALENQMVEEFDVPVADRRLLDAACGTGRRLYGTQATLAAGIDLTPEMLPHSRKDEYFVCADVRALPFGSEEFDVVWCRLALGHVPTLMEAYHEFARVCRRGARLLVTDFHTAAVAAGHRRTFRDAAGNVHEIEHHVHTRASHERAARDAGLRLNDVSEALVGPPVRDYYERAGRTAAYDSQIGLPLVLGMVFLRDS
jgi:malonyl-CoA O-methyltransferase